MSDRSMTQAEIDEFRVGDDQCATWMTARLTDDTACLLPLPCPNHGERLPEPRQCDTESCPNCTTAYVECADGNCIACDDAYAAPPAAQYHADHDQASGVGSDE